MICFSISVFVYLCTAGGRLGRFGGGGSALREVEPLELLVSPLLESTLQAILIPAALQIHPAWRLYFSPVPRLLTCSVSVLPGITTDGLFSNLIIIVSFAPPPLEKLAIYMLGNHCFVYP